MLNKPSKYLVDHATSIQSILNVLETDRLLVFPNIDIEKQYPIR